MKPYFLIFALLCCACSCQPVNKDTGRQAAAANDTLEPDIRGLRNNLFAYLNRHRSENHFDTLDDTYQHWGGPVNYPPYIVTGGNLFNKDQVHALLYYSDEQGAGLFVYLKKDNEWQLILSDTTERASAGNMLPELKDWNQDGIKDLCLYYPPALSMSVIGNYALWLTDPGGQHLRYIRGFTAIENPEVVSGRIIGSYEYHGAHYSEYRIYGDTVIKTKETWDKPEE